MDLTEVIQDSISDVELPTDPTPTPDPIETESPALEATEASETPSSDSSESSFVESPATKADRGIPEKPADDFDKRFGLTQTNQDGTRENRIPYSRVKSIVKNAEKAVEARLSQTHTKVLEEREGKLKEYEDRLNRVEHVMLNQPIEFLQFLDKIPAYNQIFRQLREAANQSQGVQTGVQSHPQAPVTDDDPRPEPDTDLADGTKVYSMEGLDKLLAWNARQAETRVLKQVKEQFGPIQESYESYQRTQALIPQIQAQIEHARTWKRFTEHEEQITQVLRDNPNLSLEGAYAQVVIPKLEEEAQRFKTDEAALRSKMRQELLAELKRAPVSTSAPSSMSRPSPRPTGAPRNLEDVIRESMQNLNR